MRRRGPGCLRIAIFLGEADISLKFCCEIPLGTNVTHANVTFDHLQMADVT
jgi:hypothetical protein